MAMVKKKPNPPPKVPKSPTHMISVGDNNTDYGLEMTIKVITWFITFICGLAFGEAIWG